MKKILLRADGISPIRGGGYRSGVGRSNVELLQALIAAEDPDIKLSVYCPSFKNPLYRCQDWNIEHHWYGFPHFFNKYINIEPWWRKNIMEYDLFHLTGNADTVGRHEHFVVTFHDLYQMRDPWYKEMFIKTAKLSAGIITCSKYTKAEIVDRLKVNESKVSVVYWGLSRKIFYERSHNEVFTCRNKLNLPDNDYFFACSCAAPRKNADYILKGFREYYKTGGSANLVMAWGNAPQNIKEEYSAEISQKKIIIIDYVNDEDLARLYSGSLASLFVSSLEGFGFPIIESMACGTPCITCKNSSLTEIGGDYAYFVRERNEYDIAEAMHYFSNHKHITKSGLVEYANSFSWEKTAQEYIQFYKKHI